MRFRAMKPGCAALVLPQQDRWHKQALCSGIPRLTRVKRSGMYFLVTPGLGDRPDQVGPRKLLCFQLPGPRQITDC